MTTLQLADLLASYPPAPYTLDRVYPDYRFQAIISNKKEFADLASGSRERPPKPGEFYKHQRFVDRFLRANDDLLLIHETGTGKTCAVAGYTEYALGEWDAGRPGGFRHVYVAVRGPAQINEFKFQLTCRCSAPGKYVTERVKKATTESLQKRNLTNAISDNYTILTYGALAKRINVLTDEELIKEFSDCIFWIDEAHNMRIQQTNNRNPRRKKEIYDDIYRLFHVVPRIKRILSTATPMVNDVSEIGPLMNLFPSRSVPEIPPDFNYNAAGLEVMYPYFAGRVSYVRALDTGVVIRDQGTAYVQDMPATEDLGPYRSQLTLFLSPMSVFQYRALRKAETQSAGRGASRVDARFRSIYLSERQAANFVYPDGSWGTGVSESERIRRREEKRRKQGYSGPPSVVLGEAPAEEPPTGEPSIDIDVQEAIELQQEALLPVPPGTEVTAFKKYVIMEGDSFAPTPELRAALQGATVEETIERINIYSSKFAAICRAVSEPEAGNAFIYCDFVEGSGAIELCICLEMIGYQRFNESTSIFLPEPGASVRAYCSTTAGPRPIRPEFHPDRGIKRYALLTQRTAANSSKQSAIIEAMNSYENRHGGIIQVIVSSPIGQVGLSIDNVLQTHHLGPQWNPGGEKQADGRTRRATSHLYLIAEAEDRMRREEETRLLAEGLPPEQARIQAQNMDVSGAYVVMKVYKHAVVGPILSAEEIRDQKAEDLGLTPDVPKETIDTKMYQLSEQKSIKIQRMIRIMKQSSVDCRIHYARNVRPGDVDGSPECDFSICRYSCMDDPQTLGLDTSTYDVYYSGPEVAEATELLLQYFGAHDSASLTHLRTLFPQVRDRFLLLALTDLITNRRIITDRYGYISYLREDGGTFYLDRVYPSHPPQYALSSYSQNLLATISLPLTEIVSKIQSSSQAELLQKLDDPSLNPLTQEFVQLLQRLNLETQAQVLEAVVIRDLQIQGGAPFTQRDLDFNAVVLGFFRKNLFAIRRPDKQIAKAIAATQKSGRPGRVASAEGGPIKPLHQEDIQKIEFDTNTPVVYVHTIYTQVLNNTLYSYTARNNKAEGRLRLLDPSVGLEWRDLNPLENREYNTMVQLQIMERRRPFEETGLYGFYGPEGKFRIRDVKNQSTRAQKDIRSQNRGRDCQSWHKGRLVDVLWELHSHPLPSVIAVGRPETPEEFTVRTVPPPMEVNTMGLDEGAMTTFILSNRPKDAPADWAQLDNPTVWPRARKEFYYKYLYRYGVRKGTKILLCDFIRKSMESQGRIQNTT